MPYSKKQAVIDAARLVVRAPARGFAGVEAMAALRKALRDLEVEISARERRNTQQQAELLRHDQRLSLETEARKAEQLSMRLGGDAPGSVR